MERGKRKATNDPEDVPNNKRIEQINGSDDNVVENDENERENENGEDDEEEDSTIFEAGMILKVHMENFMCHSKFTIALGKMLNFITGSNGSGKSAVVAAIQLCLGASARRSGRASRYNLYLLFISFILINYFD